jgi:hypothetical protein
MRQNLVGGLPTVHDFYQGTVPGPTGFLRALFRELVGIELGEPAEHGRREDLGTWESWGGFILSGAGLTWRADGLVGDSSAFSEYYRGSLPTLSFDWSVDYHKSGYRHIPISQSLVVEFADDRTEHLFHRLWQRMYDRPAEFAERDPRPR